MAPTGEPADALRRALAPLIADPAGTVLLFDFDGTLSPIVDRPEDARPADGVADLLGGLAEQYRTVGVVSGRPVAFLAEHLPASLILSGQYGMESLVDGVRTDRPEVESWRAVMAEAVARARATAPSGVRVEPKGLSLTLHFRGRPDLAGDVVELAQAISEATGLVHRDAKMSVELVPPVDTTKADVVRHLALGARAVLFVGDDVGDLTALQALRSLAADGLTTVGLAVDSAELPDEVRAAADLTLVGPRAVPQLLLALRGGSGS